MKYNLMGTQKKMPTFMKQNLVGIEELNTL